MNTDTIVEVLNEEIDRLAQVRNLLAGSNSLNHKPSPRASGKTKRTVSPEGRKRMQEAQQRRWAKARKG